MDEREIKRLGIVVGLGLLGLAVLNGAYRAGVETGLARGGDGRSVNIDGFGFFPFPPFLFLVVGVLLFVGWRRRWHGNGNGNGSGPEGRGFGGGRPPRLFEEWHRRAHEETGPPAGETKGADAAVVPSEGGRPNGGPTETKIV